MIVLLSAPSVLWVNVRAHSPRPNQLNIRIDTDSYAKIFAIICPRLRKLRLSNYKTHLLIDSIPKTHPTLFFTIPIGIFEFLEFRGGGL